MSRLALLGLTAFYGLERAVKQARRQKPAAGGPEVAPLRVFWGHMASFAVYNALVGYLLLHREERGLVNLALYVAAMVLHFVVNDYGLRQDHQSITQPPRPPQPGETATTANDKSPSVDRNVRLDHNDHQ
ncbi:MAG: hypothetical protein HUU20_12495 [Pirellulales bacterium]|nr:hypothetical protein [Pirellulales bacterium]